MKDFVSVKDFGAVGDGVADDRAAIQAALSSGARGVYIPTGRYAVSGTLFVGSGTHIKAEPTAAVILAGKTRRRRGDFLLSNSDTRGGNTDITVEGGIWDGNNTAPENDKPEITDMQGYSGTVLNFVGVKGLTLRSLTVANSTTYYIRMCRIADFLIEDIDFVSDAFGYNQDGLHFGGDVRRGRVKNIRALSMGQTNDDLIALNADDSVERVENLDLVRDDIEDITFENIYAESCYTVIRLLSVTAKIRNISFKNIYAGYRNYAINGDAARYCKMPIFKDEDYPHGVGCVENLHIENFVVRPMFTPLPGNERSQVNPEHAMRLECNLEGFTVDGFKLLPPLGEGKAYALYMRGVENEEIVADGEKHLISSTRDELLLENFENIKINKTERNK